MRQLRKLAGLRQTEVAAELHLDNETICRWERKSGDINPIYEQAFLSLVNDIERVSWIKGLRRQRRISKRMISS